MKTVVHPRSDVLREFSRITTALRGARQSLVIAGIVLAALSAWGQPVQETYLECLLDAERYAESIWRDAESPSDSGYFGDGRSGGNGGIRGTCGMALAYAVMVEALPEDPLRSRRLARIEATLRYASATHRTGDAHCVDGKQWGFGWQSCLWTGSLGLTCLLMEDELPPDVVAACKRVLAAEAGRLAEIPPPSGFKGDSKAEENAWNSNVPSLAAAWLQDRPGAPSWLDAAKRYLVNTYTVPDSADNPLADWITTTTLYPSYICENHGFFHPSYQMVSGMSLGDSLLMTSLGRPDTARGLRPFAEHNVPPVWRCLSDVLLDSGELAYPSGLDWALHGYGQVSYIAWLATHFGDPLARWTEPRLAGLLRKRQKINGDGRFTGDSVPNGFYREAVMARRVAVAWLHHSLGNATGDGARAPLPFTRHLPDAKLILQRSDHGFFSVSYGPRVMALAIPSSEAHADAPFVVTPRYPSIISACESAELVESEVTEDGFSVTLLLNGPFMPVGLVKLVSTGDALACIELPRMAMSSAAFPIGIENHALTGGVRRLHQPGGVSVVKALSGQVLECPASWFCVDDRLLYIVRASGTVRYQAASRYNRRGAAEDTLDVVPDDPDRPRALVLLPNVAPERAASYENQVRFGVEDSVCTLAFAAPRSGRHVMELRLDRLPTETLRPVPIRSVGASSEQSGYAATRVIDGKLRTFWVSSRGGANPGHGPSARHPETLVLELDGETRVDRIVIMPRPRYGPRRIRVALDDETVFDGTMGSKALRIDLAEPRVASTLRLTMLSSHDPRFPKTPRNVQVSEVAVFTEE